MDNKSLNQSSSKIELPASPSTLDAIRHLTSAIAEDEAQIADCQNNLVSEEKMLDSLLSEPSNSTNKQFLRVAKRACRTGIEAWKQSISAYQNDIDIYREEIDVIQKQAQETRPDT